MQEILSPKLLAARNLFKKSLIKLKNISVLIWLMVLLMCKLDALKPEGNASVEILPLDLISYDALINEDAESLHVLRTALNEKGIVGVKGIPGYREKVFEFIKSARKFSALPEQIKEAYAPNHLKGEMFLGYESGKEKFKRPNGQWVVDDLKVSYYGFVPEHSQNKWPSEIDLKTPFQNLGMLMSFVGEKVMEKIGLIEGDTGISLDGIPRSGRMLYYRKNEKGASDNPFWCGAHFDHGMFTALLPAFYFEDGEAVDEPMEAGLFVKATGYEVFKKVAANDPEILLFQVGEFGQLITNDAIKATEHRVQKANRAIERYTMALFFSPPMETVIFSNSELTQDSRYGGPAGSPCSYRQWHERSFDRYLVKEEAVNGEQK
jgi:isopenicillin N synthase-like dioxygenase